MKKALIYALALALALSLTACGQPSAEPPADPAPSASALEPVQDITPEPVSNEVKELSGDELLEYFQTVYDICQKFHTAKALDVLINEELEFLEGLTESDGYTLPSDYEAQYRAWRPETDFPADTQGQQVSSPQQVSDQQGKPAAEQTQKPSSGGQTQQQPQASQPSDGPDIYQGYGSYEALIDAACEEFPDLSREEIMDRIPDLSKTYVDWEQAAREAEEGLLNMGGYDPFDGFGSYDAMIGEYCRRYPELSREEIMDRNPDPANSHIDEELAAATREEGRLHGG